MIPRLISLFFAFILLASCQTLVRPIDQLGDKIETTIEQSVAPLTAKNSLPLVPAASRIRKELQAQSGMMMIVTEDPLATDVGHAIARRGGNVFDIFTAVSFTLAVTSGHATGLGGGGVALFHSPQFESPIAIDFLERAPQSPLEGPSDQLNPLTQVALPTFLFGILELHKKYGSLPLAPCLRPAITLAEEGFRISSDLAQAIKANTLLAHTPAGRAIFFKTADDGSQVPLEAGDWLIQADLAKSLQQILHQGREALTTGPLAEQLNDFFAQAGAPFTREDFLTYSPKYRATLRQDYNGYQIHTMPLPSAGGIKLLQLLKMADLGKAQFHWERQTASLMHFLAQAEIVIQAQNAPLLGDSDFTIIPVKGMLSDSYGRTLFAGLNHGPTIMPLHQRPLDPRTFESRETTQISIMDDQGNMITSTQSLGGPFGSGIVIPGTGIVLNAQMEQFTTPSATNVQHPNQRESKKRPLTHLTPTIVLKEHVPMMVLGSPGGSHIPLCLAQTLIHTLAFNTPLSKAIAAIRYRAKLSAPDFTKATQLLTESKNFDDELLGELGTIGYQLIEEDLGCRIQAIWQDRTTLIGVSDPRGQGKAAGL